ncbi:MAG: cyanophycinase [Trueperaceae bacterium]|nr:cyanophycinase [Trueperaceae bacterium]
MPRPVNPDAAPQPGALIAIGGAEDKTSRSAVLQRVMSLASTDAVEVGVITTASTVPDKVFAGYRQTFQDLGASRVHFLDVRSRTDAQDETKLATLQACGVIFISGGDQLRLTNVLGGSAMLDAIRARRADGAVVAGTSAGAAAMSATMIYDGAAADALRKGAVKMSGGLGFVRGLVIDSHFLRRGRFTRLMEVGATNPEYVGVGLGEDAGVIIHPGPVLEAIGEGIVIIVDSSDLRHSNIAELEVGEPVAVEHVIVHALTHGYGYDVNPRAFLNPGTSYAQPSEADSA